MNIFRFAGDMTHLCSIIVLLLKIQATKSCAGVSLRTQELYAVVFVTRYLDLLFSFISIYNTVMKLIFISSSFCIIWYMKVHRVISQTYDKEQDTFRVVFLVTPCFFLALLINHEFSTGEVLWTFSIYLEAVAILPQLVLLQRTRNVDTLTSNYVFLLGAYRSLYIMNWTYRFFKEPGYRQWIVWISGVLQTALYCDFFYYYIVSWQKNERLSLPS
jgi:ER lumen protein retaining receptor